jgi:transposase
MVTLSQRETQHLMILNALERNHLKVADAARLLGRSIRQTQRLRAAYRQHGPVALAHGNRGRPSPRRVTAAIRARVLQLARTLYARVNFQHLSELLAERDGLLLSRPTIHRLLTAEGIRSPHTRRRATHRRRRDRFPQAGMLVQMDGSHHAWFEDRGPRCSLLHTVDDATGTVLGAVFRPQEDASGYLLLLRHIAQTYGLPLAVYTDRHGIFMRTPAHRRPLTIEEQLQGGPAPTQVGRALQELGIEWVPASSPQAKGRIERQGGTFQDRLVVELRLAGIADIEAANAFLPGFLQRHNARFAQPSAHPDSAFRPWPDGWDPETILCFKYQVTVANDNTVSLAPHLLQILPGPGRRSYAKTRVELHERLDGTVTVYYRGQRLAACPLSVPTERSLHARHHKRVHPQGTNGEIQMSPLRKPRPGGNGEALLAAKQARPPRAEKWTPPADHPWRQMAAEAQRRKALRRAGVAFSQNR